MQDMACHHISYGYHPLHYGYHRERGSCHLDYSGYYQKNMAGHGINRWRIFLNVILLIINVFSFLHQPNWSLEGATAISVHDKLRTSKK